MKKVISGKVYDTETAERIGEVSFGNPSDFHFYDEALYRTQNGRFFLAGEGGPLTAWKKAPGSNSWSSGSGIEALSIEEALAWCEEHGVKSSVIEKHFTVEAA